MYMLRRLKKTIGVTMASPSIVSPKVSDLAAWRSSVLNRRADDRLLVQYVPHAFGFKAMNLPFCLWLYAHTIRMAVRL
jgi:hypothetical protein